MRALGQIRVTIAHAREVPGLTRFLLGRFFYSDAVNTLIVVMSVVAVKAVGLTQGQWLMTSVLLTVVAILASFGWGFLVDRQGPKRTLMAVLMSWVVGLVLGTAVARPRGHDGRHGPVRGRGRHPGQRARRRPGLGPGAHDPAVAARRAWASSSGSTASWARARRSIGQLLYGMILFLFFDTLGVVAYQLAILSLLVTMVIGLWLVRPVSDRWAGSGEGSDGATEAGGLTDGPGHEGTGRLGGTAPSGDCASTGAMARRCRCPRP